MNIDRSKILGIIPARYASTRFPGKPLVDIEGKSMIQRTYEQSKKALDHVFVATDDKKIFKAVEEFGGKVVMTSASHTSGTDRCKEALEKITQQTSIDFDIVINIQGDEPFIEPEQILSVVNCFTNPNAQLATLVKKAKNEKDIFDPNKPKVVLNHKKEAIYFSRSPIPYLRGEEKSKWHQLHPYFMHIGLYGYKSDALTQITQLPPSSLEKAESLEQLRWLENGFTIACEFTEFESLSVDTPEDLEKLIAQRNR
jgi:3-deoxy-manno-octulosonate cytidylyltransferase (CMP-KDO synthetase)